ncbi:MAG: DUF4157 domain-containing protein [Gammaproteobacteria bacterium]|nr:DUF4157 domain-containing protein [Gammaproteobacteria bacterium]
MEFARKSAKRKSATRTMEALSPVSDTNTTEPVVQSSTSRTNGSFYSAGPVFNLSSVQAKYTIGAVNDPFEQEADAVADNLIRGKPIPPISLVPQSGPPAATNVDATDSTSESTGESSNSSPTQVQTMCAECREEMDESQNSTVQRSVNVQARPVIIQRLCSQCEEENKTKDSLVQRAASFPPLPDMGTGPEEEVKQTENEEASEEMAPADQNEKAEGEEETVAEPEVKPYTPLEKKPPPQAKFNDACGTASTSTPAVSLDHGLTAGKNAGQPLSPPVRRDMEKYFGRDLSLVRIHTDTNAIGMNRRINSRAFTHENDIYFNSSEYQPGMERGRHLLAHELTHTLQQGAMGEVVQRYPRPANDVELEPEVETPRDGEEVEGRMNQKLDDHPDVKEPDELDEDEREEAENPDRGEIRQESSSINSSGETRPSVDRGAAAEAKTTAQASQIDKQVQEQPQEAPQEQEGQSEGESAQVSEADAAAQRAVAAEGRANSIQIPALPQPFRHPRIETPVDSAGEDLPRNAQIDTQVRGLGYIGEAMREKGYEMKRHAAEKEQASYVMDATLERIREELANAMEGTDLMEEHNEARKDIAKQSHDVHAESVSRQQFVAEKAPELASRADEGQEDSGELASDTQSKAERSQSEITDDPDARADAEKQSGETQESAEGAASMDQAVSMTGERARQYEADAQEAAELNTSSDAQICETEGIIEQTDGRIQEMHATNQSTAEQIENAGPGPELIRQHSERTARTGDELIAATIVMEAELNALQEQYLSDMRCIEKREDAERRLREEAERDSPQPEMSAEQRQVVELAGMSDEEQEQTIAEMSQPQRDSLMATLDGMIREARDQGTNETEGARFEVKTGMSEALGRGQAAVSEAIIGKGASQWLGLSQPDPDPRQDQINAVEQRRGQRVDGVLNIGDQNLRLLDLHTLEIIANRVVAESIRDDIMNINYLQLPKQMIMGMINPIMGLQGVLDGFDKTLEGFANIGNWEAWQKDPLGNLLQIGADISTGLAMIFSSIIGVATIITAIMVAFIIVTWGFGAVTASPVIAWMGSLITFAGKGAIICGALSVLFNYLSYIKNLHDAGTAQTAREFFGNTEQMKKNATDGFQGAMAIMEGVGAAKMGPAIKSGAHFANMPRSPGAWARQTMQGARDSLQNLAGMPGRIGRGARALYRGGRRGLTRFKTKLEGLFARHPGRVDVDVPSGAGRTGRVDVDAPSNSPRRQQDLEQARDTRIDDMDSRHMRAEMDEMGQQHPRRVDSSSEFFEDYDIEIQSNGHTYRRRRDGRGWCRFSDPQCGIGDGVLPDNVRSRVDNLDTEVPPSPPAERRTGRQQAADNGLPENPPDGYEWYSGPDGVPRVRRTAGSTQPPREYNYDAPARQPDGTPTPFEERFPVRPERRRSSRRTEYLGSTPQKNSRTGRQVIERMEMEGRIHRTATGEVQVYTRGPPRPWQERWYPLEEMDMGHHPVDAVTYWNETGRSHGPRSQEVRDWMLDPDHYELQHRSVNRSEGARLGQTEDGRYQTPDSE